MKYSKLVPIFIYIRSKLYVKFMLLNSRKILNAKNPEKNIVRPCTNLSGVNVDEDSIIDFLLGQSLLEVRYVGTNMELAQATDTTLIELPESELRGAEERAIRVEGNPFRYQDISFLLIHELGHIFHNRVNEVMYEGSPSGAISVNGDSIFVADTPQPVREYLQFVLEEVGGYYTYQRDWNPTHEYHTHKVSLTSLNFLDSENGWEQIYDGDKISDSYRQDYIERGIQIHGSDPEFVYARRNDGEFVAFNAEEAETFIEGGTYIPNLSDIQTRINALVADEQLSPETTISVYFPNETRSTAEPKEAFADAFAAYILQPQVLEGTKRGEFFSTYMSDWLCAMLEASIVEESF